MLPDCRRILKISAWILMFFVGLQMYQVLGAPGIVLTNVPAFGSLDNLSGWVVDAAPSSVRLAVFIYIPSSGWWSKPYCDPQLTMIRPDGSWTTDVTTGGSDACATRITVLLVSTNYSEPCVMGPAILPTNVTAQAIASATVERLDPNARWISFSGYDWWVKTGSGLLGPGPNYFSDSTNNVWQDSMGQLHLRITNRTNQWQCAEVITRRTFGYGSYRFELNSPVNDINPSVVLGLFTWSDDPAYTHREIDIECGRWADTNDSNNAQYVVQPWDWAGHLVRYYVPAGLTNSTHLFTWETNRVTYQSERGSYSPAPASTNMIYAWAFTNAGDVPQTGDENVRLNLWLITGTPPTDGKEAEFIIKSFTFVPLGVPQPAVLSSLQRFPAGHIRLTVNGQTDRRYQVQASTNLHDWLDRCLLLATNCATDLFDTNSAGFDQCFFRTITLP